MFIGEKVKLECESETNFSISKIEDFYQIKIGGCISEKDDISYKNWNKNRLLYCPQYHLKIEETTHISISVESDYFKFLYVFKDIDYRATREKYLFKSEFARIDLINYSNYLLSPGDYVIAIKSFKISNGKYTLNIKSNNYIKLEKLIDFDENEYSYRITGEYSSDIQQK